MTEHVIQYRATTPAKKCLVMERLLALWLEHPYLRLGQLIANFHTHSTLYNAEDFDLIEALESGYSRVAIEISNEKKEGI